MRVRQFSRRLLSYNAATYSGDMFVRIAPHRLKRMAERQFDFPISGVVRNSNLLLIRVPRSASVSLAIQVYGRVSHVPHRSALFYRAADPGFFDRVQSFAVVRDPLDRAESAFRWLTGDQYQFRLSAPSRKTRSWIRLIESYEAFVFDHIYPAFKAGNLHRLDPVLHHQRDYVCDKVDGIIVDHVFRFDQMGEVQRFLKKNGIRAAEQNENKSSQPHFTGCSATIDDALRTIYAADIEQFGFTYTECNRQTTC